MQAERGGAGSDRVTPRVLHVFDHSLPLHSGYTFRSQAIIREQRRRGWETFQITSPKHSAPAPGADTEEVDGLHFYRTPWRPVGVSALPVVRELLLMRALERRLLDVCRQVRPNILHAHSPVLNGVPTLRVGRKLGIPVVYEVRAFWEDAAVDHGTTREDGWRYRATRALETYVLRRADAVTTICEGLRSEIIARQVPANRITVIPNAVDVEKFSGPIADSTDLAQQLGLQGKRVLGFIGSFYAYEGLSLLLSALPTIAARVPEICLLLVGGGPQEEELKKIAKQLRVEQWVIFRGRVPHADVERYYDLIDVLVYPRLSMRLTETVTPLKPLEAMARRRLLVASNVGGHRELIRDRQTGRLFTAGSIEALAETVIDLLGSPQNWEAMRSCGRRFVETERSWAGSVARYAPVYSTLGRAASLPTHAERRHA
ncbi:MAG TPA: TIGR04063 family PEP-CTERM/XrtA system glycosyltransferase [Burkholderiaceae bacterium]|nr:TIGR04063 family PEP-CTERM/XrtA system glycosyltransferase [Burkholderiaceae bacterium]